MTKDPQFDRTVDPNEVAYYRQLADKWWDIEGPFWPLHALNTFRVEFLRRAICDHFQRDPDETEPLKGLKVLDIGCGGGILSESIAALGGTVTGVDVVEKNIQVAKLHASQSNLPIEYRLSTAEQLVTEGVQFDVVLNMEVVEHVADLDAFLKSCSLLIAKDGMTVIATINRTPLSYLFAIVGAEYVLRWLPKGTHQWHKFRRPSEILELLESQGIEITETVGVNVNPLNRKFSLSPRTSVNYMLVARRY
jgi:2-polyprenyl-6-hydroxyphenyl methylase/3-demethylubiquinone-9 3-methyltransferase